ncbi:hypothetical protein M4D51_08365 [Microbacterium sp. p3-SID338]|uniref:hypothetical protein n=1 Tax=unclassified Microbacterium TaxID=2609290 RepID=UPI000788FC84|nr:MULTISPECIES: hypothetical protein [unclassified Microbacterium]KYJ96822.1 hypothetical protein AUV07_03420 [Microbacterium sp. CH1]MCT1395739.1 hypothetical protein [Microbacterium sp. p3-SID338]PMC04954.1 hypothetical protein CJ226_04930 [Microbacterium sp. UMB0228]
MSSYVDALRRQIISQLDEAERSVRDTIRIAPGLIRSAVEASMNARLGTVAIPIPGPVIDWMVRRITDAALAALDDCLARIAVLREAAGYLGSPDELRAVASEIDGIGDAAVQLDINKDKLDGYMTWDDGEPTKRYGIAIENQIVDLARVEPAASALKDVLRTHADDIENYYLELAAFVGGAVIAIMGVVSAILSLAAAVLTSPSGVGAVLGIIAAALSLVTAMFGAVASTIGAVQLFVSATQNTSNKLDSLQLDLIEWRKPSFAQIE